jgi:hypothetical protein
MLHKSTELVDKTVRLIGDFQSGKIKPITTGIPHLDKACGRGLTPSLIVGICARSFSGKTYDLERIQSHIRQEHPDVIQFHANWELNFFKILMRDISQKTQKTQAEILYDKPTEGDLEKLSKVCDLHRNENIFYQNEPVSPDVFFEDVKELITRFPERRIVVTIDNLENILDVKNNQKASMDAFLSQVNRLKDMHFFISFIILNQLNDDILKRIDNPKDIRPRESDIYSTGQFYKLCDVVYVKVLPWRLHITDKFMVFSKESYKWLEEFKVFGSGNMASFEPNGVAYYFYLKRRGSDITDVEDIAAERIFEAKKVLETPKFEIPVFEAVKPNFDLGKAFGTGEYSSLEKDRPF